MNANRFILTAGALCAMLMAAPDARPATDPFANGCVSCHVVDKAQGADHRLSTALKEWTAGRVPEQLMAKAKASAPAGVTLKGKHPAVEDALEDVPAACLDCHDAASKKAPPFARLLHLVHLTGTENVFVAHFKGDCRHCHKLDTTTGAWSLPSGPEQ